MTIPHSGDAIVTAADLQLRQQQQMSSRRSKSEVLWMVKEMGCDKNPITSAIPTTFFSISHFFPCFFFTYYTTHGSFMYGVLCFLLYLTTFPYAERDAYLLHRVFFLFLYAWILPIDLLTYL